MDNPSHWERPRSLLMNPILNFIMEGIFFYITWEKHMLWDKTSQQLTRRAVLLYLVFLKQLTSPPMLLIYFPFRGCGPHILMPPEDWDVTTPFLTYYSSKLDLSWMCFDSALFYAKISFQKNPDYSLPCLKHLLTCVAPKWVWQRTLGGLILIST